MPKQLMVGSHVARLLGYIWTSPFRLRVFAILVLSGVVVGLYVNSLGNDFVQWDDPGLILGNQQIRSLDWSNVKEIFSLRRASTYQPIRVLSYAVDYHFWKLNPIGYHITNIAFYLFTCIMVFFATAELLTFLRDEKPSQSNMRIAFFTALVFSTHPVHVEAVTWLAARKEVLLGFFSFSSLYFYLRATRASERATKAVFYGIAFLSFVLATLSKPVAVVLPGIILLFEFSNGRIELKRFLRKALWFTPALVISGVLIYILMKVMVEANGIYPYRGGDFLNNFLFAFYLFILNIKLLALTLNYSPVYVFSLPDPIMGLGTLAFVLLNIGLLAFAAFMFKRSRVVFFAVFWFYITILPFSNIIPISTLLADRYVFIASFAFCLILALAFERLWAVRLEDLSKDFFPFLTIPLLIVILAGYSYMTVHQNRIWKNSFTLWSDALAKDPKNTVAMNGLGVIYLDNKMNEEALEILKKAVEINPLNPLVHNNLGIAYNRIGQHGQSEYHYVRALALKPGLYGASINLSNLYAEKGDFETAIQILRALVDEYPHAASVHFRLGIVYEDAGKLREAIKCYEKSIELTPHIINPYESLGRLYMDKLHDRERALYFFRRGVGVAPNSRRVKELEAMIDRLSSNSYQ